MTANAFNDLSMPDGVDFVLWEKPVASANTYYVAINNPESSDDGPGSREMPFRTINRAAQVLQPGEKVTVSGGVYREKIVPARGGSGPDRMIRYEAAAGEDVVVKGSREFSPQWSLHKRSGNRLNIWQAQIDRGIFDQGYNPFDIENVTDAQFEFMSWAGELKGKAPATFVRGMLFMNGEFIPQTASVDELEHNSGFYINRKDQHIFVSLDPAIDPKNEHFEITVQESIFCPRIPGLGYIQVNGFTFEHSAGPWPFEQIGAVSTARGHHWIITNSTVRWSNGVGIDLGRQTGAHHPAVCGFHVVRGNTVSDCGICGICGLGPGPEQEFGLLIEDNVIMRNGYYRVDDMLNENAGIKIHWSKRSLIRRNLVTETLNGTAIWIDANNAYTRCAGNVVLNNHGRRGIYLEISSIRNSVDHNIVIGANDSGILEADGTGQIFAHNLICKCKQAGIELRGQNTDRVRKEELGKHFVLNNIITECETPLYDKAFLESTVSGNLINRATVEFDKQNFTIRISSGDHASAMQGAGIRISELFKDPGAWKNPAVGPFPNRHLDGEPIRIWPIKAW